jgi:predicted aspartyl protease
MITGEMNADLEATIPMAVYGTNGEERQISAVIDTGFTGFLTLPSAMVTVLDLEWLNLEDALLGDGSVHSFDVKFLLQPSCGTGRATKNKRGQGWDCGKSVA